MTILFYPRAMIALYAVAFVGLVMLIWGIRRALAKKALWLTLLLLLAGSLLVLPLIQVSWAGYVYGRARGTRSDPSHTDDYEELDNWDAQQPAARLQPEGAPSD
jgi:hypothetical protein